MEKPTGVLQYYPSGGHPDPALPLLDHKSNFPAVALAGSPRLARWLAWTLTAGVVVLMGFLIFLPWQQFASGYGRVVALDPMDRMVTLEAPLAGRVLKAYVIEGQNVAAGDVLFDLADNDPNYLENVRSQRVEAQTRQRFLEERLSDLDNQVARQEAAYRLAMDAASLRVDAARAAAETARRQFVRIKNLFEDSKGLASQRDFELATLERDRAEADLARADAELRRAEADGQVAVAATLVTRSSAQADLAIAKQATIALDVQVSQIGRQSVTAPRSGSILRLHATEGSFLRAGSPLCTIVPETKDRLVELWLDGNDLPLLNARIRTQPTGQANDAGGSLSGSPVRLQFEGWPAIQLIGWPSLARGTFGGEILSIDATDNGRGQFRVLVAPKLDPVIRGGEVVDQVPWPDERWLRQGVRVHGWVLLQRVPLWFEVWRQLNGFPPSLDPRAFQSTSSVQTPSSSN